MHRAGHRRSAAPFRWRGNIASKRLALLFAPTQDNERVNVIVGFNLRRRITPVVRREVDMIRKLILSRAEGVLTLEDLHNDAEMWSRGLAEDGYASVFNLGSADVSSLTTDDIQAHVVALAASAFSAVQALVVETDEQRQKLETFVQIAEQIGFPIRNWRVFDNEEDAIDWIVTNHS